MRPACHPYGFISQHSTFSPPTPLSQNVSAGIAATCPSQASLNIVSRFSGPPEVGATNSSAGCVTSLAVYANVLPSRLSEKPRKVRSPWVTCRTGPPAAGTANRCTLPWVSAEK